MAAGGPGVAKETAAHQSSDIYTAGGRIRFQRSGIDGPGVGQRGKGAVGIESVCGSGAAGSGSGTRGGSRLGQRLGTEWRRTTAGQDLLHSVALFGESLCALLLAGAPGDVSGRPH